MYPCFNKHITLFVMQEKRNKEQRKYTNVANFFNFNYITILLGFVSHKRFTEKKKQTKDKSI